MSDGASRISTKFHVKLQATKNTRHLIPRSFARNLSLTWREGHLLTDPYLTTTLSSLQCLHQAKVCAVGGLPSAGRETRWAPSFHNSYKLFELFLPLLIK